MKKGNLLAKATIKPGRIVAKGIPRRNYQIRTNMIYKLPLRVILSYRDPHNFYYFDIRPEEGKSSFSLKKDGVDRVINQATLTLDPPYEIHIIKRDNLFLLEINNRHIMEGRDSSWNGPGQAGLWIFPETKQLIQKLEIFKE